MMTAGNTAYSQCPIVAPVPNDACYQQVIAADSWCCNNAWDGICQAAYDACNPPAGCAVVAPVPNDACYQTVIAADSWCCDNAWDATCQAAYDACMLPPPCPVVAPVPNDACYQQVIAADSWCCNNSWDAVCQAAYDACNPGGGGGPCASITPLIGCGAAVSATMTGRVLDGILRIAVLIRPEQNQFLVLRQHRVVFTHLTLQQLQEAL